MTIDLPELFDVLNFAALKHQHQRRSGYDQLPYINHLLKVTEALIRIGGERDRDLLVAALLHDVIEDTELDEAALAERYGAAVARTVNELSDDMRLDHAERKRLQVERASKLSLPARKIRIADKASNMLDILNYPIDWPLEKKQAYVRNAVLVVDQIRGANPALEAWFDEVVEQAREQLEMDVDE